MVIVHKNYMQLAIAFFIKLCCLENWVNYSIKWIHGYVIFFVLYHCNGRIFNMGITWILTLVLGMFVGKFRQGYPSSSNTRASLECLLWSLQGGFVYIFLSVMLLIFGTLKSSIMHHTFISTVILFSHYYWKIEPFIQHTHS